MILLKLLESDFHRSKVKTATPLLIETPAKDEFLPALVSTNDLGRFLVSRKLKLENGNKYVRTGVFKCTQETSDQVLPDMVRAAYDLSVTENFGNRFPKTPAAAAKYISESSGSLSQPHACVVPQGWDGVAITKFFGKKNLDSDGSKYKSVCRIHQHLVPFPVFFSRPDFVGLYTQFDGGYASVLVHNVQYGMAFCPTD